MKIKTFLIIALSMAPLGQTTRPMDYTTGLCIIGGAAGIYVMCTYAIEGLENFLVKERLFNERMTTTSLFRKKNATERFEAVTKYFTDNPTRINEKSVHPHFPKAGPMTPLWLANHLKDEDLVQWFKENGATE